MVFLTLTIVDSYIVVYGWVSGSRESNYAHYDDIKIPDMNAKLENEM